MIAGEYMMVFARSVPPFLGLLLASSISLPQTWERIPSEFSTGDTLFNYYDAAFITRNVGWYITESHPSKIFKTSDGGYHWVLQREYIGDLIQLFVLDSLHVWTRNEIGASPRPIHLLLFTTDGGISWDSARVDTSAPFSVGPVFFFNQQEGFLFGSKLFHSIDGGKSWEVFNGADTILPSYTDFVKFVDRKRGWIAGPDPLATDGGFIGATTDSGRTWIIQRETAPISGLCFPDTLTGYAVGANPFGGQGIVYSTSNGGSTWRGVVINGVAQSPDIGFLDSRVGWVSGYAGRIWKTVDSGATWNLQRTGVNSDLHKLTVLGNEGVAYAFGDSNTLLYADLVTGAHEDQSELPQNTSVIQNFPNPFNPLTVIRYQLLVSAPATVKVYDLMGREIETLVNETKPPGNYEVTWDASNVASGVYYYRLQTGKFSETRKIMVIR